MTDFLREWTNRVWCGHVLGYLPQIADRSVQCVVTSPPYWGLRRYPLHPQLWADGWQGDLGLEPTPDLYLEHLVAVLREVRRVLRDDGTLWLNMGDCYAGGAGGRGDSGRQMDPADPWSTASHKHDGERLPRNAVDLKPKDLIGLPWRVAFALQADGWWLRSDIVWAKPNPMPESVTDRPTRSHEFVFLLTKSARYFYDQEAVREPHKRLWDANNGGSLDEATDYGVRAGRVGKPDHKGAYPLPNPSGRNLRDVWTIGTQPYPGAHFAVFPEKLVEPCVKAGTSEKGACPRCGAPWVRQVKKSGGVLGTGEWASTAGSYRQTGRSSPLAAKGEGHGGAVPLRTQTLGWLPSCSCDAGQPVPCLVLDPFLGSGTVAVVAERLGRNWLGVELSDEYVKEQAEPRIEAERKRRTVRLPMDFPDSKQGGVMDQPLLADWQEKTCDE